MWTIFKVFIELVTTLLLLYVLIFLWWGGALEACGILAPPPGIKPAPHTLEGEVLTTEPPGKSPVLIDIIVRYIISHLCRCVF